MIQRKDSEHKRRIHRLTCIIPGCHMISEGHHIRRPCLGIGKRDDAFLIPLCHKHHRSGGHGVAVHAGRPTWEWNYETEAFYLRQTYGALNIPMPERVREWLSKRGE